MTNQIDVVEISKKARVEKWLSLIGVDVFQAFTNEVLEAAAVKCEANRPIDQYTEGVLKCANDIRAMKVHK